jgi:hypothetical protein
MPSFPANPWQRCVFLNQSAVMQSRVPAIGMGFARASTDRHLSKAKHMPNRASSILGTTPEVRP